MVRTRRIPALALALALACLPALVAGCGGEGGSRADLERSARRVETVLGTVSRVLPAIPIEIGKDGRVARIASFPASSVITEPISIVPPESRVQVIEMDVAGGKLLRS